VILGQVLTAGHGQNPARQAAIKAGVPESATAFGINQVCGSGLRAVALAAQQIQSGDARIVVAGGQESMSLAAHAAHSAQRHEDGRGQFADTMIVDGLTDVFILPHGHHRRERRRQMADQPRRAGRLRGRLAKQGRGRAEGRQFKDEIVPYVIAGKKGDVTVDQDEFIKHGVTLEGVSKLRPAFTKDGTVTAANASGLNDGAAALLVMSADEARSAA